MQHEQSRDERYAQIASIDPARLAAFRAGLRRRYDDDEILEELRACAERLGRSPSMREFGNDPEATVHPQTVVEHFGTWNAAKRKAGLTPRRFAFAGGAAGRAARGSARSSVVSPNAKDLDRPARDVAVEVALLAHVRLAQLRACARPASTSRSARSACSARSSRA